MSPSPLRSLVTRHVCICRTTALPTHSAARLLSTSIQRHASFSAPVIHRGSAEELRRRHKPAEPGIGKGRDVERARLLRRMRYSGLGFVLCAAGLAGTIWMYPTDTQLVIKAEDNSQRSNVIRSDAPPSIPGLVDTSLAEDAERIATGTSTIPYFPRTIHLSPPPSPSAAAGPSTTVTTTTTPAPPPQSLSPSTPEVEVEYQLLGLGIRTVSIFNIQVYVVGLYVAVADMATLQQRLIRYIDSVATTLVPGEKDTLRHMLLDPVKGEQVWNEILRDAGVRTAWRIVPTRNTDLMHMRDGFVRGITARSASFKQREGLIMDEEFGESVNSFKTVFGGRGVGGRKKIPYGDTLYLTRDGKGVMGAFLEDKNGEKWGMGEVRDERVSRLLWLNYLAGKSVSSEEARRSVVEGCVEIVSRPVGTVAAQVV